MQEYKNLTDLFLDASKKSFIEVDSKAEGKKNLFPKFVSSQRDFVLRGIKIL